jgi:hypothetical protein
VGKLRLKVVSGWWEVTYYRGNFTIDVGRFAGLSKSDIFQAASDCQVQIKIQEDSSWLSKTYYVEFRGNEEEANCFNNWYKRLTLIH